LRCRMSRHLQELSHSFFDRNPSGELVSRFLTDVELAQSFVVTTMTNVWTDTVTLIAVASLLFFLDHRLALIAVGAFPLYYLLIRSFSPRIRSASRDVQHMLGQFSGELQEQVAGISVIKSFGREARVAGRFETQTAELHAATLGRGRPR